MVDVVVNVATARPPERFLVRRVILSLRQLLLGRSWP